MSTLIFMLPPCAFWRRFRRSGRRVLQALQCLGYGSWSSSLSDIAGALVQLQWTRSKAVDLVGAGSAAGWRPRTAPRIPGRQHANRRAACLFRNAQRRLAADKLKTRSLWIVRIFIPRHFSRYRWFSIKVTRHGTNGHPKTPTLFRRGTKWGSLDRYEFSFRRGTICAYLFRGGDTESVFLARRQVAGRRFGGWRSKHLVGPMKSVVRYAPGRTSNFLKSQSSGNNVQAKGRSPSGNFVASWPKAKLGQFLYGRGKVRPARPPVAP